MASRGKKKTTMAKLNRETRLRDRRIEKAIKKEARKNAPPEPPEPDGPIDGLDRLDRLETVDALNVEER